MCIGWQRVRDFSFSFRRIRELSLSSCRLTQSDAPVGLALRPALRYLSHLAAAGFEPLVGAGCSREVAGHQPQS